MFLPSETWVESNNELQKVNHVFNQSLNSTLPFLPVYGNDLIVQFEL